MLTHTAAGLPCVARKAARVRPQRTWSADPRSPLRPSPFPISYSRLPFSPLPLLAPRPFPLSPLPSPSASGGRELSTRRYPSEPTKSTHFATSTLHGESRVRVWEVLPQMRS